MSENVVIKKDRTVTVPASEAKIGVQYDHNVNVITFDCPRYPDDDRSVDLSTMQIYINYMLPDKTLGSYLAENVKVDANNPDTIHFDWKITRNVTQVKGALQALVCIKKVDAEGNELYHWNTDLIQSFRVGEGMECLETISSDYADVISQLLVNMNTVVGEFEALSADVTARTSEETLQGLVNNAASDEKLESIVNAYMEANPVGINVDDTLAVSGDAADAKITGDRISELKSDLVNIGNVIEPINLYNGEADKGYIEYNGEFVSDNNYRASKLKLYKAGSYLFKKAVGVGAGLRGIVFKYTSDGAFDSRISGTLLENDIYKITILSDSYLRFNIGNSYLESFMIVKGTTINDYPTSYQPYFEPIFNLSENMKKIVVGKELKEPINKYNGEYEKGYITYSGEYIADASYECTKIQKYTKGSYLYFSALGVGASNISKVFFYDADGNYLKSSNGISLSESIYKITFDSDVYVRFNLGNNKNHNTFMVVKGNTLDDFPETYHPYFDSYEAIEETVKANETIRTQMANTSCLYKKSITFNGDSICYGAGEKGGYGKIIAKNNDMGYQNIGVSGATIAANTYSGDGSARHWICRTISNMNESADYAIVEGGVNDYSQSVPLGTLSTGYNAQLDDTTYYGAFESMLKQLTIRFKGKKIGYILVPQMVNGMRPNGAYYNATIECLKKWCVPYIDMSYLVPPFIDFTSDGDADLYAMRQTYTFNGDGTHPTKEGYEKYYVGKIEAWLKTL